VRNGQPSAVAVDITALMDALKIEQPILTGFDWGARTANIIAALWPERCKALVWVSGYLIGSQCQSRRQAAVFCANGGHVVGLIWFGVLNRYSSSIVFQRR
jgi:pimeloyl-ACP methyl ester carboxylesterase